MLTAVSSFHGILLLPRGYSGQSGEFESLDNVIKKSPSNFHCTCISLSVANWGQLTSHVFCEGHVLCQLTRLETLQ